MISYLLWASVGAWSPAIHKKIGAIAIQLLSKKPGLMRRVNELFGGDFQDFVSYGHDFYNEKYHFTQRLHFQPQADWTCNLGAASVVPSSVEEFKTTYSPCNKGHDNHCLLGIMYYIFGRFAHDELINYKGMVVPPVKQLQDVKRGLPRHFVDTEILRWLITLVADLHQPLHFGFESDRFGKDIMVTHLQQQYSLFDLWEDTIGSKVSDYSEAHKLDGNQFTHPLSFFEDWAAETVSIVCDRIYGKLANRDSPVPKTFEVDATIYAEWENLAREQIIKAGERTALLIENILEHKKSHLLEAEGRQYHYGEHRRRTNLMTNAFILMVFLPVWCLFQKFLERLSDKSYSAVL